jgi:hypothetical protein
MNQRFNVNAAREKADKRTAARTNNTKALAFL